MTFYIAQTITTVEQSRKGRNKTNDNVAYDHCCKLGHEKKNCWYYAKDVHNGI